MALTYEPHIGQDFSRERLLYALLLPVWGRYVRGRSSRHGGGWHRQVDRAGFPPLPAPSLDHGSIPCTSTDCFWL